MKVLNTVLAVVITLAIVTSAWAVMNWFLRGDPMLFTDGLMPKRSFDAFVHQTPSNLQEDIMIAYKNGVTLTLIPFVASTVLWFLAFVVQMWRKGKNTR